MPKRESAISGIRLGNHARYNLLGCSVPPELGSELTAEALMASEVVQQDADDQSAVERPGIWRANRLRLMVLLGLPGLFLAAALFPGGPALPPAPLQYPPGPFAVIAISPPGLAPESLLQECGHLPGIDSTGVRPPRFQRPETDPLLNQLVGQLPPTATPAESLRSAASRAVEFELGEKSSASDLARVSTCLTSAGAAHAVVRPA
jgi:hypothetical protein